MVYDALVDDHIRGAIRLNDVRKKSALMTVMAGPRPVSAAGGCRLTSGRRRSHPEDAESGGVARGPRPTPGAEDDKAIVEPGSAGKTSGWIATNPSRFSSVENVVCYKNMRRSLDEHHLHGRICEFILRRRAETTTDRSSLVAMFNTKAAPLRCRL